jgi:acetyl-CoA acetyltransferase
MTDIVIVEGARTAHGAMLGSLSEVRAPALGAAAVEELLDRSGVDGTDESGADGIDRRVAGNRPDEFGHGTDGAVPVDRRVANAFSVGHRNRQ